MPIPDVSQRSLSELFSLEGRAAVVTGGASGIGEAIVRRLAEAGASVLIGDLDEDGAERIAAELRTTGVAAQAVHFDTRSSEGMNRLADAALRAFGRLDIWVNDAGIYPLASALEVTDEEFARVLDTNVTGVFNGARAAARKMRDAGGGVIVNIASSLGYHGVKMQSSYVASKWAVRGLTAALAMEWTPLGIRVLAIGPGLIDTPGMEHNKAGLGDIAGGDPWAAYAGSSPSGRIGQPDDIARAVLFAVSDAAMFMTGSTLLVDGGEVAAGGAG